MTTKHDLNMKHVAEGIYLIDPYYLDQEGMAGCYLLAENRRLAFFETNTNHGVHHLLAAISALGHSPTDVEYVILSHIHLDHAGGTGLLMKALPNARLVVHARGRKHMIDPEKLIEGVKQVYGEEKYHALYGEILPIDKSRVVSVSDTETLHLGGRTLELVDSPGHAKHHMVMFDKKTASVFSGDAFGIGYPLFDFGESRLVFPSTSPVQFDPNDALATYDKIRAFKPQRIMLTHFGMIEDIAGAHEQLQQWIAFSVAIARQRYMEGYRDNALSHILYKDIEARFDEIVRAARGRDMNQWEREFLYLDCDLNGQGLAHYITKLKENEM